MELLIDGPVACDSARVSQLLSNLVSNALVHGAQDGKVRVRAATPADAFELSVSNLGAPIPLDMRGRLFQPFFRAGEGKAGLGLGLYIANEIARAHGGELHVASSEAETRFTFRMPAA